MTREEEIRARAEAELKNLQRSPLVMISGPRVETVLGEDITYMLDEDARLRAELEAAKRDIRWALEYGGYVVCEICARYKRNAPQCVVCAQRDWRGLCAENGGQHAGT